MALTIDAIGKRYGMLPIEVMSRASTFDIFIMDVALTYEQHMHDKTMKQYNTPQTVETKQLTDEKVLDALKKFKEKNG